MAKHLGSAGYQVVEVIAHHRPSPQVRQVASLVGARATTLDTAKLRTDLVWLCVPDSQIEAVATRLAAGERKTNSAFHSSGVLTSDALRPLRKAGATVASVHPLMTFVRGSVPSLKDVPFAIEGDPGAVGPAKAIVRRLGGKPVTIRKQDKPAYHLFATLICPLLISLLAASERAAMLAGLSPAEAQVRMLPILHQTISNYGSFGASRAFTGPFARGDVQTVRLQLEALSRSSAIKPVYVSLAEAALQNLPHRHAKEIRSLLRQSLQTRR